MDHTSNSASTQKIFNIESDNIIIMVQVLLLLNQTGFYSNTHLLLHALYGSYIYSKFFSFKSYDNQIL